MRGSAQSKNKAAVYLQYTKLVVSTDPTKVSLRRIDTKTTARGRTVIENIIADRRLVERGEGVEERTYGVVSRWAEIGKGRVRDEEKSRRDEQRWGCDLRKGEDESVQCW